MKSEIIAVGSEMLTPFRQDTNSLYLTEKLNEIGVIVAFKTIVGDRKKDLDADIEGGVGQATIHLPTKVGVLVRASGGIGAVNAHGLKHDGDEYTNDIYGKTAATIHLKVEGGVGEIDLIPES